MEGGGGGVAGKIEEGGGEEMRREVLVMSDRLLWRNDLLVVKLSAVLKYAHLLFLLL